MTARPSALANFNIPSIFVINGVCGSGKTFLIKSLVYQLDKKYRFNHGLVVSPTAFNGDYNYLPERLRYNIIDDELLEKLMAVQKEDRTKKCFLILDDCLGMLTGTKVLKNFISTFRHYNITIFVVTQNVNSVPPLIRQNAAYVFAFYSTNMHNIKTLRENYFTDLSSDRELKLMVEKNLTQPYSWILVRNHEAKNRYVVGRVKESDQAPGSWQFNMK